MHFLSCKRAGQLSAQQQGSLSKGALLKGLALGIGLEAFPSLAITLKLIFQHMLTSSFQSLVTQSTATVKS